MPTDLAYNRGLIADPAAFARDAGAASWLFLCGEEFAEMEGGMSYVDVQAAVPESANLVADPPRPFDMDVARRGVDTLDRLPRPTLARLKLTRRFSRRARKKAFIRSSTTPTTCTFSVMRR